MKVVAFYLPQFHEVKENNEWWGKGFTEWVNVKKAKPMFEGHLQPRKPLNENYYDLSDVSNLYWQAEIARKYGVYAFCFYHYWHSGKLLLEKPVEMFLEHKDINLNYCICWANHDWTNGWVSKDGKVLRKQTYGDRNEWKEHFMYLLPYFQDDRYIKIDNKPMLLIYNPGDIKDLEKMLDLWETLAKENGFSGLAYTSQNLSFMKDKKEQYRKFTYAVEYQPNCAIDIIRNKNLKVLRATKRFIFNILRKTIRVDLNGVRPTGLLIMDYDRIWNEIINMDPILQISIPGAFVNWDNTPRKHERGSVINGMNLEKFRKYFAIQVERARTVYKKDMIFMFAWNEWAEGGFMEPDEEFKYGVLETIRDVLEEKNELPF